MAQRSRAWVPRAGALCEAAPSHRRKAFPLMSTSVRLIEVRLPVSSAPSPPGLPSRRVQHTLTPNAPTCSSSARA